MNINTEYLKSLKPCEDRLNNWVENYKDFNGSLLEFLDLDKISHDDKIWVFARSISGDKLRLAAADFAESVLHIFEEAYPDDKRPREAIAAARDSRLTASAAAAASDAAASRAAYATFRAAYAAAASAAAAAYAAAAYAAAASAAAYAAAASRAAYAVDAYAVKDKIKELGKQIEIMKKYLK